MAKVINNLALANGIYIGQARSDIEGGLTGPIAPPDI